MTADERLELIRVKVDRAKEHFRNLEMEVRSYLATNPYVIGTKRDPQTRRLIYFLVSVRATPPRISSVLGDTIHNLRSALDHLAYQLVWIGTGKTPSSHVYFPIADESAKYPDQRRKQMKGAHSQAITAIDALSPYRGGNDTLWKLHKLNNVDKHRVLITAGSAFRSINLGAHLFRKMQQQISSDSPLAHMGEFPTLDAFFRPADHMFPLKQGDELFIDAPDATEDEHLQFRFDVAFGEPSVVVGEPLIEALRPMVDLVDSIILDFKPLLA